jgi:hypothetical protein
MVITFRSTGFEERIQIERQADGRQRVAKGRQSDYNPRHWDLELQHPSGQRWTDTFISDGNDFAAKGRCNWPVPKRSVTASGPPTWFSTSSPVNANPPHRPTS